MQGVTVFDERAQAYDRWFDENPLVYQAEVAALRICLPAEGAGMEVGVGGGRFAAPLGAAFGVDPAWRPLHLARSRGVAVCQAFGERLPFPAGQFAYVLLVTVDPFVPDVMRLLEEARRVLKPGGRLVVGAVDKSSPLGRMYEAHKDADPFYREARFHTAGDLIDLVRRAGFGDIQVCQTIMGAPAEAASTEQVQAGYAPAALEVRPGHGAGAFVGLAATKT